MLETVMSMVPEAAPFCHLAYSGSSILSYGDINIPSVEGVQQGDPLGPLLFCLTIHNLLSSLTSDLVIGYLDDLTLGGAVEVVVADVERVPVGGLSLGLRLNNLKSEFIGEPAGCAAGPFHNFVQVTP